MASHYVTCAIMLEEPEIDGTLKLLLVAIADSASMDSRIAMPGLEFMLRATNRSRSQVFDLIAQLVEVGLITRHRPGRKGQRAEFIVFPHGCCQMHGPVTTTLGESTITRSAPTRRAPSGSGGPDPEAVDNPSLGSGRQDPDIVHQQFLGSGRQDPESALGSGIGSGLGRTPFELQSTFPPNPPAASRPGGTESQRSPNPNAGRPVAGDPDNPFANRCSLEAPRHANCRRCGTSSRAAAGLEAHQSKRTVESWIAAERAARDRCSRCDQQGFIDQDDRVRRCDHGQPARFGPGTDPRRRARPLAGVDSLAAVPEHLDPDLSMLDDLIRGLPVEVER